MNEVTDEQQINLEDFLLDMDNLHHSAPATTNIIPNNCIQDSGVFPGQAPPVSLSQELRSLSIQALAQGHLGSSSGLSFAQLTQTVLRRLSPEKADFVFRTNGESGDQNPLVEAVNPTFSGLSGSVSLSPKLFGVHSLCDITETEDVLSDLRLPTQGHRNRLVDFYFACSYTLYPILSRHEITLIIEGILSDDQSPSAKSPLCLFKLWIVLAIGSANYCALEMSEESEPMLYYSKAMLYFEAALGYGDMAALEVLALQVCYSFFNQLGPNTWFLVGLAARMAVGIGLHSSPTYDSIPVHVAERQKRLFFSVYMMDRVVSLALGRPFALNDEDIDVLPFVDAIDGELEAVLDVQNTLQPSLLAVPLHILRLRRIASKISKMVYSANTAAGKSQKEREEIIRLLHQELVDWRRTMPFPLPDIHPRVPQLCSSWYDFNFYTHLAMLYRPSPLSPTLNQARVKILLEAATMSIRQAMNMHRQQRFAYNWLNLLAIFTSSLSLIYATTAQPNNLVTVLKETEVVHELESAMEILETLGIKFTAAKKIRHMIGEIVERYQELCRN